MGWVMVRQLLVCCSVVFIRGGTCTPTGTESVQSRLGMGQIAKGLRWQDGLYWWVAAI